MVADHLGDIVCEMVVACGKGEGEALVASQIFFFKQCKLCAVILAEACVPERQIAGARGASSLHGWRRHGSVHGSTAVREVV